MSLMIRLNDSRGVMSFSEYCSLLESFAPKETPFGLDSKDGLFEKRGDYVHTFFSQGTTHCLVHVHVPTGEFGFGTHIGQFTTDIENHYDESPKHVGTALTVFNKVMFVALAIAKHFNLQKLQIRGANDSLKSVYSKAVQNEHLQKHLKTAGYDYAGSSRDGVHHFKKTNT
jgi:hypothetical protein